MDGEVKMSKKLIDSSQAYFWTKEWQEAEREATEDIKAGRVNIFDTVEELVEAFYPRLRFADSQSYNGLKAEYRNTKPLGGGVWRVVLPLFSKKRASGGSAMLRNCPEPTHRAGH